MGLTERPDQVTDDEYRFAAKAWEACVIVRLPDLRFVYCGVVMVVSRKLAFSVTADDCDWQTMTAGGPGGQHQNRSQTAVRVVHRASGAVGESREFKSQIQNKRAAFRRMAQSPTFREWVHERLRQLDGRPSVEEVVETMMQPHNLRVEVRGPDGWTIVP